MDLVEACFDELIASVGSGHVRNATTITRSIPVLASQLIAPLPKDPSQGNIPAVSSISTLEQVSLHRLACLFSYNLHFCLQALVSHLELDLEQARQVIQVVNRIFLSLL